MCLDSLEPMLNDPHERDTSEKGAHDEATESKQTPKHTHSDTHDYPILIAEIKSEVSRAITMLSNIRLLSRGRTNKKSNIDINSLVRKAFTSKEKAVADRGISYKLSLDDGAGIIHGVSVDILVAVHCLIDNAIDALSKNDVSYSDIEVSTIIQAGVAKIIVRDNGAGIDNDTVKSIFKPFYSTKNDPDKLGMGLTIAKRNVERCGGVIDIVAGIGAGTIARITLPLVKLGNGTQSSSAYHNKETKTLTGLRSSA